MNIYYCDICGKKCVPDTISIEVGHTGCINGKLNTTEQLEKNRFDICLDCMDKVKNIEKLVGFMDIVIDGIKNAGKTRG